MPEQEENNTWRSDPTPVKGTKITRHIIKMGRTIRPIGERTARITLVAVFVFVLLLEANQVWNGVITNIWNWLWNSVLVYRTVDFGLGLLTCYLIMRHRKHREEDTVRHTVFKTMPIRMDIEALEEHARQHGVELHLRDDPRISQRNPLPKE